MNKVLYKKDRLGNTRVWSMEYDEEKYRTISGLENGKKVESGWVYPTQKNIGKSNVTSVKDQVLAEVAAQYKYQLSQGKYHETEDLMYGGSSYVECMLAEKYVENKTSDFPYVGQPKLDGSRALGVDKDTLQTRKGKKHVSCPHILEDIEAFQKEFPEYVLDGELYNHDLKNDFEKLMSLIRRTKNITAEFLAETREKVFFYVYDIITPEPMKLEDRLEFLEKNVYGKYPHIRPVPTIMINNHESAVEFLGRCIESGYEGAMYRKLGSYYEENRSKSLLKHKQFEDMEVEIVDILEGLGNWAGCAKTVVIKLPSGIIQESGIRGTQAKNKEILENKEKYIGGEGTCRYPDKTRDGKLRFPVITYLWGNKRDV